MLHESRAFQSDKGDAFAAAYPLRTARFAHALSQSPLFSLNALAQAALQLPASSIERRHSGGGAGGAFPMQTQCPLSIDEHILAIAHNPGWIMLAKIEQIPAYAQLMQDVLASYAPVIKTATGALCNPIGFIFISSKGAITPCHFDPEYNLFMQVAGAKNFTTFPAQPPLITDHFNETYHMSGNNMVPYDAARAHLGTCHAMVPGDGLFIPYKAPHWVEVGDDLSISLSITWRSDWSYEQEYAHRFNSKLRIWGITPRSLPAWPRRSKTKALAARILGRIGMMK